MTPQHVELTKLAAAPRKKPVKIAWRYLVGTHETVTGLFDSLEMVRAELQRRKEKDRRGRLSHDEQNLIRAALAFAGAGLDASLKQLVRDTLPMLIESEAGVERMFKKRITIWLGKPESGGDAALIRDAVLADEPRGFLVRKYVHFLTEGSLQATDQLQKVRDALGLTDSQIPDASIEDLKDFFQARNQIVHELDFVASTGPGIPGRRDRSIALATQQCDQAIQLTQQFILATTPLLPPAPRRSRSSLALS